MRWRLFMRKLSVSAPRVSVRSQLSWPLRALLLFLFAAVAAAAGVAIYEYGRNFAGPGRQELALEVDRLGSQLREAQAERDRNAALATASDSELKVQKAAQEQLEQQVRTLETDNTRLQEDLSFFESLLPASKSDGARGGVVIRSFRAQPDEQGGTHYKLLVQQSGKPDRDFIGSVQLQVSFVQNARAFTLTVPDPRGGEQGAQNLQLAFRHYQRVEGNFTLPAGSQAHSVLVRILAGGETRYQQNFSL